MDQAGAQCAGHCTSGVKTMVLVLKSLPSKTRNRSRREYEQSVRLHWLAQQAVVSAHRQPNFVIFHVHHRKGEV